jgi:plasmid stability protein
MKKVTISLDEKVARWTRIRAAEHNTSISRLVGELLQEKMREEEDYHLAMEQYLVQEPRKLKEARIRYPRREDLHDR